MRRILWSVLLAGFAASQARAAEQTTRSVTLSVYTKKAEPVSDLKPEELIVSEAGRKTTVLGVDPDHRPLEVAIVVDSSAAQASSYRSDLVASVISFWKALPSSASVAVWTSGPPSKVVDFGNGVAEAEPRLQSVAPAGKNYAFDAMLDASRELARRPSQRRVLVVLGNLDIETTRTRTGEAQQAMAQAFAVPFVILMQPGGAMAPVGGPTSGVQTSFDVRGYFETMAPSYGGACWTVLSSQAASNTLKEVAAALVSTYRVRYDGTSDQVPKVEVKRKGVKYQVGRTQVEVVKAIN